MVEKTLKFQSHDNTAARKILSMYLLRHAKRVPDICVAEILEMANIPTPTLKKAPDDHFMSLAGRHKMSPASL